MVHAVEEAIEGLLETSSDLTCTTLKSKPDYLFSNAAYTFMRMNMGSQPPVYHNPWVDKRCQELVSAINVVLLQEAESRKPPPVEEPPEPPKKGGKAPPPPEPEPEPEPEPDITIKWDGSISNMIKATDAIESEDSRKELLKVIPEIRKSAEIPPHPSSAFHLAMYKILQEAVHPVHDAIEDTLADLAAKKQAEEEARLVARRKKAEEEGLDPDMLEPEEPEPPPEPQYDEEGNEIPPPPPPKLYECVPVASAVKDVLFKSFLRVEGEIEKLEDAAVAVVKAQTTALKTREPTEKSLWDIFALERERLFLVLSKEREMEY